MTTYYFRYVDPDSALKLAGRSGYAVWYYTAANPRPAPWTDPNKMPEGAQSAVVRADHAIDLGIPMGEMEYGPGKDPVPDPPPPPPPYRGDLSVYLKSGEVSKYFAGGRAFKLPA